MRLLRRLALIVVVLLLFAVVGLYGLGGASLPRTTGTADGPGLDGAVMVHRDARGVPTIEAETWHDAWWALGYAQAQDRLFQLDLHRRVASGRLSELMGPRTLGVDRTMRTLGLVQAARSSWDVLGDDTRAALTAYAEGINAGRDSLAVLPPEYLVLRADWAPWTPLDTLAFSRLMALRLSGNWRQEALNASLLEALGPSRFQALLALDAAAEGPTTIPRQASLDVARLRRLAEAWPAEAAPLTASNWWLVGPGRSTGGALLANDPHLELGAPIQWYLATLRTPEGMVSGGTIPAIPFPLVGHNGALAWGLTTTHSDTADLVIETLSSPDRYKTPEGDAPFTTRTEEIAVKGGAPEALTVRETRHGPVVDDLVDAPRSVDQVVALRASALAPADRTADAMLGLTRATTWGEAMAALKSFHAPQQNIALAFADGTIGFVSPGRLPVRGRGDGRLPRPGEMAEWDWRGWQPFAAQPRQRNPASGVLVNANNRPVPRDWPAFLGADFPPPFRAARIEAALNALPRADAEAMHHLQLDVLSPPFSTLKAHLGGLAPGPARDLLLAWDGRMRADQAAPLLYAALLVEAQRAVFADDLGESFAAWGGHRVPALLAALDDPDGAWCAASGCRRELRQALAAAEAGLTEAFGPMASWRWGAVHRARLVHPLFGHIPGLADLTDLSVATPGGAFTVNRGDMTWAGDSDWAGRLADVHGPGLRFVIDMARPGDARAVIATGQSGHVLSPHYGDQVAAWRDGLLPPLQGAAVTTLRLAPVRSTR